MILKKHFNEGRLILAICDKDLLDKTFEDSTGILNLKSGFYKGDDVSDNIIIDLFKKAYIINAVGAKSVALLVKEKMILSEQVKQMKKVPYVQIMCAEKK